MVRQFKTTLDQHPFRRISATPPIRTSNLSDSKHAFRDSVSADDQTVL